MNKKIYSSNNSIKINSAKAITFFSNFYSAPEIITNMHPYNPRHHDALGIAKVSNRSCSQINRITQIKTGFL